MAYRIVKEPRAWWPVSWPGAAEDGTIVTNTIELRFRLLKVDAVTAYAREVADARATELESGVDPAIYAALAAQIATDWRGVEAENGDPLRWDVPDGWLVDRDAEGKRRPLAAPNLTALMNEPGLFTHVFDAFRNCLNARAETRAGN